LLFYRNVYHRLKELFSFYSSLKIPFPAPLYRGVGNEFNR